MATTLRVRLTSIITGVHNLRTRVNEERDKRLSQSLAMVGLQMPLVVRETSEGYVLVDGHRRHRLLRGLKSVDVEVEVRRMTAQEASIYALTVNSHSTEVELTAIEEAQAVRALREQYRMTTKDVAARLGYSDQHIRNLDKVLRITPEQAVRIDALRLGSDGTVRIALIRNSEWRTRVIERLQEGDPVRRIRELEHAISVEFAGKGEEVIPPVVWRQKGEANKAVRIMAQRIKAASSRDDVREERGFALAILWMRSQHMTLEMNDDSAEKALRTLFNPSTRPSCVKRTNT